MSTITRKSTAEKNVWELVYSGSVIGVATAIYKTPTQRTWSASITADNGTTVEVSGIFSIKQAISQLEEKIIEANGAPYIDVPVENVAVVSPASVESVLS